MIQTDKLGCRVHLDSSLSASTFCLRFIHDQFIVNLRQILQS